MRDLTFEYPGGGGRLLDGVNLEVRRGDWILLEGESGGGKSTLVAMLTGLRQPDSGMLAGGLDRQTLGARQWRKGMAAAPQYQENHVPRALGDQAETAGRGPSGVRLDSRRSRAGSR